MFFDPNFNLYSLGNTKVTVDIIEVYVVGSFAMPPTAAYLSIAQRIVSEGYRVPLSL